MMRFLSSALKGLLVTTFLFGMASGEASAKIHHATSHAKKQGAEKSSSVSKNAAQPKGDWQVGMIKNDKGEFNYCLMRADYNNDLSLAIALSPRQEINIGVGVPKGGFSKDEKHPINVKVDAAFGKDAVALAAEPELLIIPMRDDKKLYDALRRGKTLTLTGAEDRSVFALKNTDKAMKGLQQCVDVGTGKLKPPTPAEAKAGQQQKQQQQAEHKLKPGEFPPSLKGLLVKSGLKDLEILSIKDPSKAPVDFAWRTQGVFGGMRERPVPPEATIEKMSEILEQGYKKQCNGMFSATTGDVEAYSGIKLRKAEIMCQLKDHMAYVALFYYLTDNHLFTMFMHEGDGDKKETANKARDGIATTIRQLAKEQPPAGAKQ